MGQLGLSASNTFCISLDAAPERWSRMMKRFERFDLHVTRWRARTPSNLTDRFADYMGGGARACAQTHVDIWRHVVATGLPYALILEDDARFDRDWRAKLDSFGATDWLAIFFNASESIEPPYTWARVSEQYLTAGYVLSAAGARVLLDMFRDCFCTSDWMTSRLQLQGPCYSYFPWLIVQEHEDSAISANFTKDRQKMERLLGQASYSLSNYV